MKKVTKPKKESSKNPTAKLKSSPKRSAKTILSAPKRTRKAAAPKRKMNQTEFHAKVAQKAYEIYESRGHGHGNDFDDWLKAEKLVLSAA